MPPLAIGLMSGTSGDGISAALVEFSGRSLRVRAHRTTAYSAPFARRLQESPRLEAAALSSLNVELGERFAAAALALLRRTRIPAKRVAVIGSHGHTVYHGPRDAHPSTLQIGEPAVIAERLGVPVVADFRPRDIAAGGEGAPLVPAFDQAFFGGGPARALLNIGGIANVTIVGRGIDPVAFDTGPGNCLIDLAVQNATRGRERFDRNGRLAAQGRMLGKALDRWWAHPYFSRKPPKSSGRELFNEDFIRKGWKRAPSLKDQAATLTCFTAYSIIAGIERFAPKPVDEIIVSGGGVFNRALMGLLAAWGSPARLRSIQDFGIAPLAKEPAAFAWLAWQAIRGKPNHLPATTGARRQRILGALHRALD